MTEPTYTIAADGKSITCHLCGLTSHNLMDVTKLYCGRCHLFHIDQEIEDQWLSKEFDCSDCGRHMTQLAGPFTGKCGACTAHPGWFLDPMMAHIIDPGNLRHIPPVH